jgi:hypothetical protein
MGGECLKHGERRHARSVLVVKPEVQRPLSRPGRKWESNSKMNFTEIGREAGDAKTGFIRHGRCTSCGVLAHKAMNPRVQ